MIFKEKYYGGVLLLIAKMNIIKNFMVTVIIFLIIKYGITKVI